ncbi:UDP-N-acetylmuramoyl-tripeptide--D-alanyl-D-alanine ligase [Streptomyces albogriseolus]|uniref:UDP-N-acetylmuramoyl-tripeptide--D-alanyl-D-alanine ligase n=1 Tax=Streptomyces albogriseolus TaxID=1887 RepID=A0ACC6UJU9_STRAO|nr:MULTISPECIES: UDP-N-acetylmuramoyl-tripeptide--D-alanyl-D-alanine ligase [Streptomyces]MCP9992951.1 UDP-N-acetylmuramoyl-tripeptide--D-alanyl-D-alanine ligase [Streptomyces albogriseolus]MCX4566387.1 UDP-N-acetylmuramoyl-tripeptide--D-alanyl-D-alanine ligase [Streptomyces viridodiastaticus]MCX4619654.1 UDP-N-acetylmuramoyl-tripeptide--D-alanyl-D-alanine ligase [Streptomyces viridodiastaticus]NIL52102.1 UDP-N-acetylmuramoyl-tripeptide--D-alanyl-D-alanine ligase [Streptomyces sp. 2BBP-J2]WPP2
MIALSLAEIAEVVGGQTHDIPDPSVLVTGEVVRDSREAGPGSLFVAFVGERVDGHDFAAQVVEAGAVAVLASRPVGVPAIVVEDVQAALGALARHVVARLGATLVALTGSAGKTSTKDLIAQVLRSKAPTVFTPGSLNNEIGLPLTALTATEETKFLVLEMGARGIGHIRYLTGLTPPRIGLVLNVGSAHIGEFGGREQIAQAKGELVESLPPAEEGGVAVLNADDPYVRAMASRTKAKVILFGESGEADVSAENVRLTDSGQPSFRLHTPSGASDVTMRLYGEHHVSNALAAAAVAHELGMSADEIARALSEAGSLSRWRMEVTERPDGVTVVNDAYNANPESMKAALRALAAMGEASRAKGGRTWAVLGKMAELGDEALAEHDAVGRLAVRLNVSKLVAVGGREAAWLQLGAYNEGSWGEESVHVSDAQAAVDLLRSELRPGDVVLVKASRSVGLESVAQALLETGAEGEVAAR